MPFVLFQINHSSVKNAHLPLGMCHRAMIPGGSRGKSSALLFPASAAASLHSWACGPSSFPKPVRQHLTDTLLWSCLPQPPSTFKGPVMTQSPLGPSRDSRLQLPSSECRSTLTGSGRTMWTLSGRGCASVLTTERPPAPHPPWLSCPDSLPPRTVCSAAQSDRRPPLT